MLEAKALSKSYKHKTNALTNLSLQLFPGKITCLAGPNGSGKTTTLRLLALLIRPTSGTLLYNGLPVEQNDLSFKSLVGYLPERCGFHHRFTGRWNLAFYASLFGKKWQDADLDHYIKLLEFDKYLDKPVGTYSFGTKQKLALLRSLSIQPAILLLDEPFNGLDIESQFVVKQIFKQLCVEQKILFIATHLIAAMEDILDRVVILSAGEKIADMEMPCIHQAITSNSQLRSITDFYLYQVRGATHENK